MIFVYDAKLAFKYIFFAFFLGVLIVMTLPFIILLPVIVVEIILGYFIVGLLLRAYDMLVKRIIVSEEGISYYKGSNREKTLPWNIIDNNTINNNQIIMRVQGQFFYLTSEIREFHLLHRLLSQHLALPMKQRGTGLPKRADLEKVRDLSMIQITRDHSNVAANQGPEGDQNLTEAEYFGTGEPDDQDGARGFEDTGKRYDFEAGTEYFGLIEPHREPRAYIPPDEKSSKPAESGFKPDEDDNGFGKYRSAVLGDDGAAPRADSQEDDDLEDFSAPALPVQKRRIIPVKNEDDDDEF